MKTSSYTAPRRDTDQDARDAHAASRRDSPSAASNRLIALRDVPNWLPLGMTKIRELISCGALRSVRIGKRIFCTQTDIEEYVERLRAGA